MNIQILLIFATIAYISTAPARRQSVLFDQRQDGEVNVQADVGNFVVVVMPTSFSAGVSLLDLLKKNLLKKRNTNRKHAENRQVFETSQRPFIDWKTQAPYYVDLTKYPDVYERSAAVGSPIVAENPEVLIAHHQKSQDEGVSKVDISDTKLNEINDRIDHQDKIDNIQEQNNQMKPSSSENNGQENIIIEENKSTEESSEEKINSSAKEVKEKNTSSEEDIKDNSSDENLAKSSEEIKSSEEENKVKKSENKNKEIINVEEKNKEKNAVQRKLVIRVISDGQN